MGGGFARPLLYASCALVLATAAFAGEAPKPPKELNETQGREWSQALAAHRLAVIQANAAAENLRRTEDALLAAQARHGVARETAARYQAELGSTLEQLQEFLRQHAGDKAFTLDDQGRWQTKEESAQAATRP